MKLQTLQVIGFTAEIVFYVSTGYALRMQKYSIASVFLAIAFGFAIWTGKLIKQEGREERK
jgi:hypothetical protein